MLGASGLLLGATSPLLVATSRVRIDFQPALLSESDSMCIPNDIPGHCSYANAHAFKHTGVCPISSLLVSRGPGLSQGEDQEHPR